MINYQQEVTLLFNDGKYKEVITLVDSLFGWTQEELGRKEDEYTFANAQWALKLIY